MGVVTIKGEMKANLILENSLLNLLNYLKIIYLKEDTLMDKSLILMCLGIRSEVIRNLCLNQLL